MSAANETGGAPRHVLTFRPRRGRVTPRQRRALDALLPRFGVEIGEHRLDQEAVFGRRAPLVLEIGSGMGEATLAYARAFPSHDVLAVDVHTPGIGALLAEAGDAGLSNVRVAPGDALDVLRFMLAPGSLTAVHAFFPDPWPKARHHKRRLVREDVMALIASRLRPGGEFLAATDWADYAGAMLDVIDRTPGLVNPWAPPAGDGFAPRPAWRPVTKFEGQARAAGGPVREITARRVGADLGAT